MNKVKLILLTLLVFILLNAIIVFLWPIRTDLKFTNYRPYSKEFINSLNLNEDEALKLYLETWQRERLFEYDEFTGLKESDSVNGKYVNITKENGRLISNNPKNCEKNIFFYGGEIVFGYDVADNQSIPFYFSDILKNSNLNYCVFNFGRKTYYSTQENILLQKHIIQNKINNNDIIVFIDGDNENGNKKLINTNFIEKNYNDLHQKYWKLYKVGITYFISLLPITQFTEVLIEKTNFKKKINSSSDNLVSDLQNIQRVFKKNLKIRNAICDEYNLSCYNIMFFTKSENKPKYKVLKNSQNINDLTNFDDKYLKNKFHSLSPDKNKSIAAKIYKLIIN